MKVPYSYRQQFFAPVFLFSFIGHAVAFATGAGFFSLSPQFGVQQAPSSMEVVISKVEPDVKPKPENSARVLTALQHSKKKVAVKKVEKPKNEKREFSKPVTIPPQKGALQREANRYLKNPAPVYPQLARERGWEGVVLLSVFVQSDGKPGKVNVEKSSGYKILDDAALKAIRKWQFKPAAIGNISFATWVRIPIRFTLVDELKY